MKEQEKILHNSFIKPDEYSRIQHTIIESDFYTSHPSPSRIDRFSAEIGNYLKQRRKLDVGLGGDKV